MSETRVIGLAKVEIGDVGATGAMGTTLAQLGVTLSDSAELSQADPTETDINSEENDDPEEILYEKGKTTFKFSIIDYTPATLAKVLGGEVTTVAPIVWKAPATVVVLEKSIKITSKSGVVFSIVRAKVAAKLTAKFSKKGVAQVDITATVMTPTLADTPPMTIGAAV